MESQPTFPRARRLPLQFTPCSQCPPAWRRQGHCSLHTFAEFMTGRQRLASVGHLPFSQNFSQKKKTNNTHETIKTSSRVKSKAESKKAN